MSGPTPDPRERLLSEWAKEVDEHGTWTSGHSIAARVIIAYKQALADLTALRAERDRLTGERDQHAVDLLASQERCSELTGERDALQVIAWRVEPPIHDQTDDADTVATLTAIVRKADEAFQASGGSSRHWVRDCFLPLLNQHGYSMALTEEQVKIEAELAEARARLAVPPQDQELIDDLKDFLVLVAQDAGNLTWRKRVATELFDKLRHSWRSPAWQANLRDRMEKFLRGGDDSDQQGIDLGQRVRGWLSLLPPPDAEGETRCDLDPLANVNEMGTGNIK